MLASCQWLAAMHVQTAHKLCQIVTMLAALPDCHAQTQEPWLSLEASLH